MPGKAGGGKVRVSRLISRPSEPHCALCPYSLYFGFKTGANSLPLLPSTGGSTSPRNQETLGSACPAKSGLSDTVRPQRLAYRNHVASALLVQAPALQPRDGKSYYLRPPCKRPWGGEGRREKKEMGAREGPAAPAALSATTWEAGRQSCQLVQ